MILHNTYSREVTQKYSCDIHNVYSCELYKQKENFYMNEIKLKWMIRNIEYSHTIGDIEYDKAEILVPKFNGGEDVLQLRFKKFSNKYQNNQQIELSGNIRSYSEKLMVRIKSIFMYSLILTFPILMKMMKRL